MGLVRAMRSTGPVTPPSLCKKRDGTKKIANGGKALKEFQNSLRLCMKDFQCVLNVFRCRYQPNTKCVCLWLFGNYFGNLPPSVQILLSRIKHAFSFFGGYVIMPIICCKIDYPLEPPLKWFQPLETPEQDVCVDTGVEGDDSVKMIRREDEGLWPSCVQHFQSVHFPDGIHCTDFMG